MRRSESKQILLFENTALRMWIAIWGIKSMESGSVREVVASMLNARQEKGISGTLESLFL